MKNFVAILMVFLVSTSLFASEEMLSWSKIQESFIGMGGQKRALKQVQCFFEQQGERDFSATAPTDDRFNSRCYDHKRISLDNKRYFAVIDYTKSGFSRRFFIVDRKTAKVEAFAVAHGRYKAGYINIFSGNLKNTLKSARYFSNEIDSNASATGFFIAGQNYNGGFGKSMVLHGLEKNINDNACERAIVVHPSDYVSLSSAKAMSSGCPMISPMMIDHVRELLAGSTVSEDDIELTRAGGLVYVYGPREAALSENYCETL